jgi:hypothetical protein
MTLSKPSTMFSKNASTPSTKGEGAEGVYYKRLLTHASGAELKEVSTAP